MERPKPPNYSSNTQGISNTESKATKKSQTKSKKTSGMSGMINSRSPSPFSQQPNMHALN